ncbi:MAG: hypothetical protein J5711_03630 [Bacteroidales bacterium]|nr:hypothetical protein [Bacteroidales bacterium]
MKRFFIILLMLVLGESAFSQTTDSLCRIPVMQFKDTPFLHIVDTLIMLEQHNGFGVSDNDKISITFIDAIGQCCEIHVVKDNSLGVRVLSSMVEYGKMAHYKGFNVLISGTMPYNKVMSESGEYEIVECVSYSEHDILYEDYTNEEERPSYSLVAKWNGNHMQMQMITNDKGEIIYDSSVDSYVPEELLR